VKSKVDREPETDRETHRKRQRLTERERERNGEKERGGLNQAGERGEGRVSAEGGTQEQTDGNDCDEESWTEMPKVRRMDREPCPRGRSTWGKAL
jgi:hypothetical protein